ESVTSFDEEEYVRRKVKQGWDEKDARRIWQVSRIFHTGQLIITGKSFAFVDTGSESIFIDTGTNKVFFETLLRLSITREEPQEVAQAKALRGLLGLDEPNDRGQLIIGRVKQGPKVTSEGNINGMCRGRNCFYKRWSICLFCA
ncbi:MAG: hypothetical protein NT066_06980, partial [Candidatus Omnitrophica bacterium]|nr:hypothetical protein [Candidatus Omnitrophota bacterium]